MIVRSLIVLVLAGTVAGQDCVGLADTAASGRGETSMSSLPMYHTLHQLPLSSYAGLLSTCLPGVAPFLHRYWLDERVHLGPGSRAMRRGRRLCRSVGVTPRPTIVSLQDLACYLSTLCLGFGRNLGT